VCNISLPFFPILLQWLTIRMVLANITTIGLIWVFLYSTNIATISKLVTLVKLGNNTKSNMPKAINLFFFSIIDPCSDFFLFKSASNSFHYRPLAFFSKNLVRLGTLSSFDNSIITLSSFKGKETLYRWSRNSINIPYSSIVGHRSIFLKEKHL